MSTKADPLLFGAVVGALAGSILGSAAAGMFADPVNVILAGMALGGLVGATFAGAVAGEEESWPTTR